jgi:hypothetical protein
LWNRNLEFEDEDVYVVLESLGGRRVGQWTRYGLRHLTLQRWKCGQSFLRLQKRKITVGGLSWVVGGLQGSRRMRTWLLGKGVREGEEEEEGEEEGAGEVEARSMGMLQLAQVRVKRAASVCL